MQNLFLVPTDKRSRLWYNNLSDTQELLLSIVEVETSDSQHIYITSDEEIKEGEKGWLLENNSITKNVCEFDCSNGLGGIYSTDKKIILTTDQDLIANGVQAIDDEFLEWFVKNPKVEYVQVERLEDGKYVDYLVDGSAVEGVYENYKIIIPQEESKCTCEEHDPYCCEVHGICPTCVKKEEPKQETIEEVAKKYSELQAGTFTPPHKTTYEQGFEDGAKYQADNMYSLDEIKNALKNGYGIKYFSEQKFLENLEQLKKKQ